MYLLFFILVNIKAQFLYTGCSFIEKVCIDKYDDKKKKYVCRKMYFIIPLHLRTLVGCDDDSRAS